MTKSSNKKKPTGAKLPNAKIIRICLNNSMPHCAVIRMPTLKAAKQAVRFANMSYEQKVETVAKMLNSRASGPEFGPYFMDIDRKHARKFLALMGHTP